MYLFQTTVYSLLHFPFVSIAITGLAIILIPMCCGSTTCAASCFLWSTVAQEGSMPRPYEKSSPVFMRTSFSTVLLLKCCRTTPCFGEHKTVKSITPSDLWCIKLLKRFFKNVNASLTLSGYTYFLFFRPWACCLNNLFHFCILSLKAENIFFQ